MRVRLGHGVIGALVVVLPVTLATPANASTIWTGDPSQGTAVFRTVDCASPGTVTVADDATMGAVFRYSKPAGDNRCESRGIAVDGGPYQFADNETYFFGWWSSLSSTVDNNANFQWKSYPAGEQDWPVVLKMVGGRATVIQRQPGDVVSTIWSAPVSANSWNHYVIGIHTSDALTGGWVELWHNGEAQTFSDGSTRWPCRTWDGYDDPKWGVYGAEGDAVTNEVAGLAAGTSYADVANTR